MSKPKVVKIRPSGGGKAPKVLHGGHGQVKKGTPKGK
jgi:hypothetical protein